jgi:hypothetical protein
MTDEHCITQYWRLNMVKEINSEWAQQVLKEDTMVKNEDSGKIDWVRNGTGFKKAFKFKVLPANSKENRIFSHISAMHWNLGPNKDKYFTCTEQTAHLKSKRIVCPICEAKRRLLREGFKEEELCTQGRFGPMPIFDPTITSNVKVVMLESDVIKDLDAAHISILQQKGSFLTKWLVEKYLDNDCPDFLQYEGSNVFKFTRPTENGKWEREMSFATFNPSEEVLQKLKEENEKLTMFDIWKAPSDAEILEAKDIADKMVEELLNTKRSIVEACTSNTTSESTSDDTSTIDDDIPF